MNAAVIAHEFPNEFIATFSNQNTVIEVHDALNELYCAFREFDLMSFDSNMLAHITGEERNWTVPNDARDFIMNRAENST